MKEEEAQKIAEETRQTYDAVADEFSASRSTFWGELAFLAEYARPNDRVLDIGCSNGRLFPLIHARGASYVGVDYSEGLIREAKRLHPEGEFVVGDGTALPFVDGSFDIAYASAVIHHVPGKELRTQFVREAARILHFGGTLILTTWELWTSRHIDALVFTALKSLLGLTPLDIGDVMLTFGKNKAPRYLHAFSKKELSALLTENGFRMLDMASIPRPSGEKNIVVIAQKI